MKKILITVLAFTAVISIMSSCNKTQNNTSSNAVTSDYVSSNFANSDYTSSDNIKSGTVSGWSLLGAWQALLDEEAKTPSDEKERLNTNEEALIENMKKLGNDEYEAMQNKYIKTAALHNDIGYIEKTEAGIEYNLTKDIKNFKKYTDLIMEKTDYKKIVFKKDCIYFVLNQYNDKNVTFTIYSKPLSSDEIDDNIQKGFLTSYCHYEERPIDD